MFKLDFFAFYKFSIVFCFLLFIYSGALKWLMIFPIDATVLFAIPLVLVMIVNIVAHHGRLFKPNLPIIMAVIALLIWIVITCTYTISDEYYKDKLLRTVLIYITFFFPVVVFKDYSYIKNFVYSITIFGGILILVLTVIFSLYGNLNILFYATELEDLNVPDYLVISEILGAFILLNHSRNTKVILPLKIAAFAFMVMLGGRGPILFLTVIYTFLYIFKTKLSLQKVLLMVLVPFVFLSSISFFAEWEVSKILYSRIANLAEGDVSLDSRGSHFNTSLSILRDDPIFGTGYGGYGMASEHKDYRAYPHNIILELYVETGIVGLALILFIFVSFFLRAALRLYAGKDDICSEDFAFCAIFFFLNAMKSSSFIDIRNLFGIMGVILAYYSIEYKGRKLTTGMGQW